MNKTSKTSIFDILKYPIDKYPEKYTDEALSGINSFVLTNFITGIPKGIPLATVFNRNITIEGKDSIIPKQLMIRIIQTFFNIKAPNGVKYVKYPKNIKLEDQEYIYSLCEYFNINPNIAQKYLKIISKKDLKRIYMYIKKRNEIETR